MNPCLLCLIILLNAGCQYNTGNASGEPIIKQDSTKTPKKASADITNKSGRSYEETKEVIFRKKMQFSERYRNADGLGKTSILNEINDFWIYAIGTELYEYWRETPWDFNGTTTIPKAGKIACGFFITTILQDIGYKLNRRKLAICPSSEMMKALTPHQRLKNLSYLSFPAFCDSLSNYPKGVFLIGLDFHTGFIVKEGQDLWFIHSNYIKREGVIKERIENSIALKSSKTRWLVSLTSDKDFIQHWLNK